MAEAERRRQRPRRNEDGVKVVRIQSARGNTPEAFPRGPHRLPVPSAVARLIGPEVEFTLELTEDGILYRKVGGETSASALPGWLR